MNKLDILEGTLFAAFVATTDVFVAINIGWAFFTTFWNSLASIVPIVSIMTLVTFLAFALLEDHLRGRRYGADGFQS